MNQETNFNRDELVFKYEAMRIKFNHIFSLVQKVLENQEFLFSFCCKTYLLKRQGYRHKKKESEREKLSFCLLNLQWVQHPEVGWFEA